MTDGPTYVLILLADGSEVMALPEEYHSLDAALNKSMSMLVDEVIHIDTLAGAPLFLRASDIRLVTKSSPETREADARITELLRGEMELLRAKYGSEDWAP